jgi:hypothetical protein
MSREELEYQALVRAGRIFIAPLADAMNVDLWEELGLPADTDLRETLNGLNTSPGATSPILSSSPISLIVGGRAAVAGRERPTPTLEEKLDRAIAGLCPCGAEPAEHYAPYCGYDCVPNIVSDDTDSGGPGSRPAGWSPPTPMRWLPGLVSDVDDTGLQARSPRRRRGPFWAETFDRQGQDRVHLRLDDGCRFVGVDVPLEDPDTFGERCERAWNRLEAELTDQRRAEPGSEPAEHCQCPICAAAIAIQICDCGACGPDEQGNEPARSWGEVLERAYGPALAARWRAAQQMLDLLEAVFGSADVVGEPGRPGSPAQTLNRLRRFQLTYAVPEPRTCSPSAAVFAVDDESLRWCREPGLW